MKEKGILFPLRGLAGTARTEFPAWKWRSIRRRGVSYLQAFPQLHFSLDALIKRGMDVLLSFLALALFSPLFGLIALAIKLDSPGKVFFVQWRVGRFGKLFRIYKFRTMYSGVSEYAPAPTFREDPRITRLGRILRRTSLDELPQLVNVLFGEMSLVGPRPEMPFWVEKYTPLQSRRLFVKPGLTGLWQVNGRMNLPLLENLKYDLFYVRKQSIWLDFWIILKTFPAVLSGKGAY